PANYALARGERAASALPRKARQRHGARCDHTCQRGRVRVAWRPGDCGIFAPAHETRGGDWTSLNIDIGQRVVSRIEALYAQAWRQQNHPGAGRNNREWRPARAEMREQRGIGVVDTAKHADVAS